jgi:hypothetical protein
MPPPHLAVCLPPPSAIRFNQNKGTDSTPDVCQLQDLSSLLVCCKECHDTKYFKNIRGAVFERYPFTTVGQGLEPGSPVHVFSGPPKSNVPKNVSPQMYGLRGIILGWSQEKEQHQVWIEGTTLESSKVFISLNNLRVIQVYRMMQFYDNMERFEEVPIIRPKAEASNFCPGAAIQLPAIDEAKRTVLNSILLDVTTVVPRSIILPSPREAGIYETSSLSETSTLLRELVVEKRMLNGYACVLCGWIQLADLITGDSPYIGNTWNAESASSMAIFSLLSSKAAMNALVEFLVQTPYIGHEGNLMDEFFSELAGINEDVLHMTPDQKQKGYIAAMTLGPLKLLHSILESKKVSHIIAKPFMNALLRIPGSPLLIHRLSRIVSRESLGTLDGITLGPYARKILQTIVSHICRAAFPPNKYEFLLDLYSSEKPIRTKFENVTPAVSNQALPPWFTMPVSNQALPVPPWFTMPFPRPN